MLERLLTPLSFAYEEDDMDAPVLAISRADLLGTSVAELMQVRGGRGAEERRGGRCAFERLAPSTCSGRLPNAPPQYDAYSLGGEGVSIAFDEENAFGDGGLAGAETRSIVGLLTAAAPSSA